MEELKKIKKSDADRTIRVTIEVTGFPGAREGAKFFEQIVKEEYRRLFEGSNLRVDHNDRIVFNVNVCSKTAGYETEWYAGSEAMAYCLSVGTGYLM